MKNFLKSILLICCLLCTEISIAQEINKIIKYPPYPEIWGYDILDTIDPNSRSGIDFATLPSGDLVLRYRSKGPKYGNDSVSVIHFFEGKNKELNAETNGSVKYLQNLKAKYFGRLKQYISLNDKEIIDTTTNYNVFHKYPNNDIHNSYVRRRIDFEKEGCDYKKSVLGISPYLDNNGKIIPFKYVIYYLPIVFFKFQDNTFIAFHPYSHLIIRFDRDFNTKFKPEHTIKLDENRELKSNFYILPYSNIEYFYDHVAQNYTGEQTEDIDKQLLNYLYELEHNKNLIEG